MATVRQAIPDDVPGTPSSSPEDGAVPAHSAAPDDRRKAIDDRFVKDLKVGVD